MRTTQEKTATLSFDYWKQTRFQFSRGGGVTFGVPQGIMGGARPRERKAGPVSLEAMVGLGW